MTADADYDVIIIGGGHNGLLCGAYLAKSGANVLIVEKKHQSGGGLVTEDFQGPFRFNLHTNYMLMADVAPSHQDLRLKDHSLRYITPDVQIAFHHNDGKAIVFHRDSRKTEESIARFSSSDAGRFRDMFAEFESICDEILIPSTYSLAVPPIDQISILNQTELGSRLVKLSEMTPVEIIESYGFENEKVKGALLYLATLGGIAPGAVNVGYLVPFWISRMCNAALVQGGSHVLASSFISVYQTAGGKISDGADVTEILIENGKAVGIKLKDGTVSRGRAIVSTVNPEQTFLQFMNASDLPEDLVVAAKQWQREDISLFTSHYGIVGQAPDYTAAQFDADANRALMNIFGIESVPNVLEAHADVGSNRLNVTYGRATCTSSFDNLAAVGQDVAGELNTLRFEMWAPYQLDGEEWDDVRKDYSARCLKLWQKYAPNLKDASVGYEVAVSPRDIERRLSNMKQGSHKEGAYCMTQMKYLRADDPYFQHRTPVDRLYLGGAAVYPGGMKLLGSGYNAAKVVAEDLGLDVWWPEPGMVRVAKGKNYL